MTDRGCLAAVAYVGAWAFTLAYAPDAGDIPMACMSEISDTIMGIRHLHALTGDNDPRFDDSVVGPYKCRESGWQVWGGLVGGHPDGGVGFVGNSSSWGGQIDPKAQTEWIKKWQDWRQNFQLITAEATTKEGDKNGVGDKK